MTMHRAAILWLRRDLRLTDNPALQYARQHAESVIPIYVYAPGEEQPWEPGAASRWWLHHSLKILDADLRERHSRLTLKTGETRHVLDDLIAATGATLIVWNRLYDPATIARDKQIKSALQERGLEVESCNASLLFEPWTIKTQQGEPYKVFTAFWRNAQSTLAELPPLTRAPATLAGPARWPKSATLESFELLPTIPWDTGLHSAWTPGEKGALAQLQVFRRSRLQHYHSERNRPDHTGTSALSPHLHFGEIGPRQIVAALSDDAGHHQGRETYVKEIGWREFAHHLLFHFPATPDTSLDRRFESMRWRGTQKNLRAWQRGLTGYPIVDAGMRELWHTGWMHNRVRMIVASFLTKNLGTHWVEGAKWFWDTLVDADLAANTLGWQWTAGCGADAAPYYRVFNPVLQAEKFDPNRDYLRRWIPEIAKLDDKYIHQPWEADEATLKAAGIKLGSTYPKPIVDLKRSREEALEVYEEIKVTKVT